MTGVRDATPTLRGALRFMTIEDQRLLLERARHMRFGRGEVIIAEGSRRRAIFLLEEGFVRIERAHLGQGIAVARRGPGGVFGEMAFVEGDSASASVIADEELDAAVIDDADVQALLASVPGFATRFYQSLTLTLSQRLRELTASLPPLIVEDVPQVTRFATERSGRPGHAQLPPTLVDAVEAFKTAMLETDRGLKDRKLAEDGAQVRVGEACDSLEIALREHIERDGHLEGAIGTFVFRETFPFFMLSRFTDRAFSKPRGYAGDYATIEMIYQDTAAGDGRLGRLIDRWTLELPAAQAVKNRRSLLVEAIRDVAASWPATEPVRVTSLASGPAREFFDVLTAADAPNVLATCVDIDHEALAFASGIAQELGLSGHFTFAQDNVVRLTQGRGHTALEPQALIYSVGLTDYLHDAFVVNLIDWAHELLLPGGTLIVGNVIPSNPTRAFMDHILEWVLIHRSEAQLRELFARSRFGSAPITFRTEPSGVDLFAFCRKT
jgi:extracellular factor (EF) 3-hydroxypalmitic acid methyl ester biosynthesis protein